MNLPSKVKQILKCIVMFRNRLCDIHPCQFSLQMLYSCFLLFGRPSYTTLFPFAHSLNVLVEPGLFPVWKVSRLQMLGCVLLAGSTEVGHRLRDYNGGVKQLPQINK